ncbi:class I SAM-dependent RNA methyltransferase, partial [Neisseria gonorrhoeae]
MNTLYTLFATCPRGLETVLSQELGSLGCTDVQAFDGGVSCRGGLEQAYAANLHSRTAGRILLRLTKGTYRTERDIYKLAKNINWFNWFTLQQTFKVKIEAKRANVKSLQFAGLTVKDAVCDAFRDIYDARPSVDKAAPDVRIHAFLDERNVEIFIDTSGEALFKRGYRLDTGEAPLRENLAAGLLLSAGYDGTQPFQDPFCGSGTIAIEAAWIAAGRAPGMMRRFGFEKLQ